MVFDLNKYVDAAIRTESPYVEAPLDFKTYRLLHGAMGVMTEAGELFEALDNSPAHIHLDVVNINEEIGDACWYAALLCDVLGLHFPHLVLNTYQRNYGPTADDHSKYAQGFKEECLRSSLAYMVSGAGVILDQCKRKIYYRTKNVGNTVVPYEIDAAKCEKALQKVVIGVVYASRSGFGESIETICAKNILKLAKRYPDEFLYASGFLGNLADWERAKVTSFSEAAAIERDLEAERGVLEADLKIAKQKADTQ